MDTKRVELDDRVRLAHMKLSTKAHIVLAEIVNNNGFRIGAEIGVLKGRTLFGLLDLCPNLAMYGVDQWEHIPYRDDELAETYTHFDFDAMERKVRVKAASYGLRCAIIKGDSAEQAARVHNGSLDFVFIDADHTEAGITRDIDAWYPKVRSGGMVLGHDCHWPTVKRVIDARFPGWKDYGEAVWGIRK